MKAYLTVNRRELTRTKRKHFSPQVSQIPSAFLCVLCGEAVVFDSNRKRQIYQVIFTFGALPAPQSVTLMSDGI